MPNCCKSKSRKFQRFDFERRAHALFEVQPLALQQGKHCSGIRGADNGAEQQTLQPVNVQQPRGQHAGEGGADDHAYAGQGHRWPEPHAKVLDPGAHAAVEQNDCQRQTTDHKGRGGVIEDDATYAVDAGEHPDDEEDQQQGDAQPRRERAGQNARTEQHRAYEKQGVYIIHTGGGSVLRLNQSPLYPERPVTVKNCCIVNQLQSKGELNGCPFLA